MKKFKVIFRYISFKWTLAFLYFFYNLISLLFSLISFTMLPPFLKFLLNKEENAIKIDKPEFHWKIESLTQYFKYQLSQIVLEYGHFGSLIFLCLIIFGSTIFKNLFLYLANFINAPLRNSVSRELKQKLFFRILDLPLSFFSNKRKGDIMVRMSQDIQEIETSVISAVQLLFKEPIIILVWLGVMWYNSPRLLLCLIILSPILGLALSIISKKLKSHSTIGQVKQGELMSLLEETLSGLRIVKSFTAEKVFRLKFAEINNDIYRTFNYLFRRRDLASPLSETISIGILCIVILYGGHLILNNQSGMSGDTFIMFVLAFTQILPPIKNLSGIIYNIKKGNASIERIEQVIHAETQISERQNQITNKSTFDKRIEYKNVSQKFGENQVLDQISFKLEKGKTLALVGASGSGKSTLVDLLSRFIELTEGDILIDGISIKNINVNTLRKLIGLVSQEAILFNNSISNNINLQNINVENIDSKIHEAAKIAFAYDFIMQKELGFETNVGDRGNKLSGGEKQRITIARAVLKDSPILILDEATSALDTVSEKWVQDALNNLMKNRTTIVIAHRLSTVKNADEILVMDKGKIVEQGTHATLIQKKGVYYNLVEMQDLK